MAADRSGTTGVAGSRERLGIAKNEKDEESIILLIKSRYSFFKNYVTTEYNLFIYFFVPYVLIFSV